MQNIFRRTLYFTDPHLQDALAEISFFADKRVHLCRQQILSK